MGYKSPFIKPFLNKTKKFTKENKIQKNKLFNIFKKRWREKKQEGHNSNMLNNKGFFPCSLLIQNTSQGYTYRAQEQICTPGNPSIKSKAGIVNFFLIASTYRDWNM
ncbi:UNVERIFIED_CONTAM: hypothetical protein K2H54_058980 [Gekko kuhli]